MSLLTIANNTLYHYSTISSFKIFRNCFSDTGPCSHFYLDANVTDGPCKITNKKYNSAYCENQSGSHWCDTAHGSNVPCKGIDAMVYLNLLLNENISYLI